MEHDNRQTADTGSKEMPITRGSFPMTVERDVKTALWRGWRRKCPRCGTGPLFHAFLKVRDSCPVCQQDLRHHRADDGPAYLTILIVGHLIAPLFLHVFLTWRPEPLTLFTIFAIGAVVLSLYLLPRLKGATIAFQWARKMHGFGAELDHDNHIAADDTYATTPQNDQPLGPSQTRSE